MAASSVFGMSCSPCQGWRLNEKVRNIYKLGYHVYICICQDLYGIHIKFTVEIWGLIIVRFKYYQILKYYMNELIARPQKVLHHVRTMQKTDIIRGCLVDGFRK